MNISEPNLKKNFLNQIELILGTQGFSISSTDRLSYCRDANYRATIQAHYNQFKNFPAIITWPQTTEQIQKLVKCGRARKWQYGHRC